MTPQHFQIISYGLAKPQFIEWFAPRDENAPKGLAMLVHGGFWRGRHGCDMMRPMAEDLVSAGWAVANIEYRRGGCGGDWPVILEDVCLAMQTCREHWHGKNGPLIGIGHSVGGQLVLLAESQQDAVVALAPVTDVTRTQKEGLGEDAAMEFFRQTPEQAPAIYRAASPVAQLPLHQPALVVHGDADERVPVEHSRDYVEKAANSRLDYLEVPGLDHMQAIDPEGEHWRRVKDWMEVQAKT